MNNVWSGVSSGWYIDNITIDVVSANKTTPYSDNFESGLGDWWASNGSWQLGTPTVGPENCNSGTLCMGTVLDGNYPNTDTSLVSPSIKLADIGANQELQLRFWHWFAFAVHANGNDTGRIYIQTETSPGVWSTNLTPAVLSTYYGTSGGVWTETAVDLSAFAGTKVRLEFRLVNNVWSGVSSGWYIDDTNIRVVTTDKTLPFTDDFELGLGDWWSSNGSWQLGTPTIGPGNCNSGTLCVGTVLDGNYPNTDTSLITPAMSLPAILANQEIQLRFWHWFAFAVHANGNDTGRIYVQTENTPGVWTRSSTPLSTQYGTSGGVWTNAMVDLSAYANTRVRLEFRLVNNIWSGVSSGWFVDDAQIEIVTSDAVPPFTENFETGMGQ